MHPVSVKYSNDVGLQKCLVPHYLLKNSVLKPGDVVSIDYGSRFIICRIQLLPPTDFENSVIINNTVWFSHKVNIGCVANNQVLFPGDFNVLKVTVFKQIKIKLVVQNEQVHLSQYQQHYKTIVFNCLQSLVICKGATINCCNREVAKMFCINRIIIIGTDLEDHIYGRLSRTSSIEISEVIFEGKLNLLKNLNNEMGGFDDAKRMLNFYLFQQICQKVIVTGPPGCGKSMLVKKYCFDLKCSLVTIDGLEKFDLTNEKCDSYCEYLIQNSSKTLPGSLSFLFIDHLDKLASSELKQGTYSNSVLILQRLLKKLQHSNVYVIATSVQKSLVHPALACFFKEVFLGVPSVEQRKEILQVSLKSFHTRHIDFDKVSSMLPGFIASDIIQLIEKVIKGKENGNFCDELPSNTDAITTHDFEQALLSFTPSILKNSKWSLKVKPVYWNDIGGMGEIKKRLQMCIEKPLSHPELFEKVGLQCPTGVLLFGPPGCCKTTLARGLATECHANFFAASPSQIYSAYVGESEKNISQLFYQARICAPSIIFLDELDSLVGHRDLATKQQGIAEKVLSTLLNEMDGSSIKTNFKNTDVLSSITEGNNENMKNDVIVVAATNRPDCIDNALLRPGRFDVILYVPPPNYEERVSILQTVTEGMPLQEVDFKEIADKTEYFTGADLKNLCNMVAMYALRQDINEAKYITQDCFLQVLKDRQPSITKQQIHMYEKLSTKYGPVISE